VRRTSTIVLLTVASFACFAKAKTPPSGVASMEQKLHHIETNAGKTRPDQTPTIFSEKEVNAYIASDNVELPVGVQSVKLVGLPGVITGTAQVDFDRVREGAHSSNPLLSIFSGVHEVVVVARAHGARKTGYVHVDSVSLDGVEVPHLLLELFVEKYLTPKYPQIGIDSQFALPNRIDTATVGLHQLAVTQK
jgi:hypothetical protein